MKKALILSGIPWNTTIQRHHNIAMALDKQGYEVYFIEKIPSSKFTVSKLLNRLKTKYKGKYDPITVDKKKIKVINMNFVNPMKGLFFVINKYKSKKLIKIIGGNFDVVINYLPVNTTEHIETNVNSKISIYDCVRDFENWGGYPKDLKSIERSIVNKSKIVLTDSYYLTNKVKQRYRKENVIQILPTVKKNHVDILMNSELKNDIKNIVYFGAVGNHIDINILNRLSNEGYKVHIIGQLMDGVYLNDKIIYHGFVADIEILIRKISTLADAIIIPYKGNMDGVIPAKLMQCIATGLPIFINEFYDAKILNEFLYVFKDYNDLKDKINKYCLKEHAKRKKKMLDFVSQNTEEKMIDKLNEIFSNDYN